MGFLSISKWALAGLGTLFLINGSGEVAAEDQNFSKWKDELRVEALEKGIDASIYDAAMKDVTPIKRVIELDKGQPETTMTFQKYQKLIVSDTRIKKARQKYNENRQVLEEVGKKIGVQPRFIVALWGIETNFGGGIGGFMVVDALATLAYPNAYGDWRSAKSIKSRSAYFRKELLNAFQILNEGHIAVKDMKGSWAGAMGQCQFMPSSFLNFAVDYDGDGHKDIWKNKADVFGSAANYLSKSGWKGDQTWGRPVTLPKGFDLSLAGIKNKPQKISYWQGLGVRRMDGRDLPTNDIMASIVLGDGKSGPAFMVYNNYRTILKWNRSTYFAVAVGSLADRIVGR